MPNQARTWDQTIFILRPLNPLHSLRKEAKLCRTVHYVFTYEAIHGKRLFQAVQMCWARRGKYELRQKQQQSPKFGGFFCIRFHKSWIGVGVFRRCDSVHQIFNRYRLRQRRATDTPPPASRCTSTPMPSLSPSMGQFWLPMPPLWPPMGHLWSPRALLCIPMVTGGSQN